MEKAKLGTPELVYRNRVQSIYRRTAEFDGIRKEYFVVDTGRRVGVVVEGPEGILLTRQYRLLIDRLSWEIPGGRVEAGEDLQRAARRECDEETGIRCEALVPLIHYHPGLDTYYNPTHVFYSRTFAVNLEHRASPEEGAEHHWVPLAECLRMIVTGDILDSLSIISLLAYKTLAASQGI